MLRFRQKNRLLFWLLTLALLVALSAVIAYGLWRLPDAVPDAAVRTPLFLYAVAGWFLLSLLIVVFSGLLDGLCLLPLRALERGSRIIAHGNPGHRLETPSAHLLGELPDVMHELGATLQREQRHSREAGAFPQLSKGVSDVVDQGAHIRFSVISSLSSVAASSTRSAVPP